MATFKITLAYDGTGFVGWQRQADGVSIQGLVEEALRPLAGTGVAVAGAGRTDAGVHAVGQVASFTIERSVDAATIVRAMNARLPREVRVLSAEEVPSSFHARFSARGKTYRYRIWNAEVENPFERSYSWHVTGPLDVEAMDRAARSIEGEHDFAVFQASGGDAASTVRRIVRCRAGRSSDRPDGPRGSILDDRDAGTNAACSMLAIDVAGDGFLRHMVRTLVGSLVEIGRGRRDWAWIRDLIAGGDRAAAGRTAPAHGLFLMSVDYDDACG